MRTLTHRRLLFGESYNATTSTNNFGSALASTFNSNQPVTLLAYIYPTGIGEGTAGYILAKSAGLNGLRLFVSDNTGNPTLGCGLHSSTAAQPSKNAANNSIVYNQWNHVALTSTGALVSSGLILYSSQNGRPLIDAGNSSAGNGGGSINSDTSNNFHIGNREGTDRTFNGQIAYVARWNRVLTLIELREAQQRGPLAISGAVLVWANGRDYGPSKLKPTTITAITNSVRMPRNVALGGPLIRPWLVNVPAVGGGARRLVGGPFRLAGAGGLAG